MESLERLVDRLGGEIGQVLRRSLQVQPALWRDVREIRIRAERPLVLESGRETFYITERGVSGGSMAAFQPTREMLEGLFQRVCQNSLYAFTEDIKNGFVTLPGGHRVGIAGHTLVGGGVRDVSSVNVRIARQIKGCSEALLPHIIRTPKDIYNTLILSPPCCGKTTVIRDLARALSTGRQVPFFTGVNVGIVDERSEIAACYQGVPSHDVGIRTDVYDGCPKDRGIFLMLRALAPDVIVTDEIGGPGDGAAIFSAINAGVRLIATAHGFGWRDVRRRKELRDLGEAGVFERIITLSNRRGPGTVEEIRDGTEGGTG